LIDIFIVKKSGISTASMPYPLRIYFLLKNLNRHKLNVQLSDLVPKVTSYLILQLEYITSLVDNILGMENVDVEDMLED